MENRGPRDHRPVVRTQARGRPQDLALRRQPRSGRFPQSAVARDPPGQEHRRRPNPLRGPRRLLHQHVHDRRLERRADVGQTRLDLLLVPGFDPVEHGRLQPAEGEVQVVRVDHRTGEVDRGGVALARLPVDDRPTGKAQPQQLRHLVECLAGGVVASLAEQLVSLPLGDVNEHRVAAGDDQRDGRQLQLRMLEQVRHDVGFHVMDGDQREIERHCQPLGKGAADHQRAHQPRSVGHPYPVDLGELDAGLVERLSENRQHVRYVSPTGELGNDAAELLVGDLTAHDVREEVVLVAQDRDRGVVAGGLDPQCQHFDTHFEIPIGPGRKAGPRSRLETPSASRPVRSATRRDASTGSTTRPRSSPAPILTAPPARSPPPRRSGR